MTKKDYDYIRMGLSSASLMAYNKQWKRCENLLLNILRRVKDETKIKEKELK